MQRVRQKSIQVVSGASHIAQHMYDAVLRIADVRPLTCQLPSLRHLQPAMKLRPRSSDVTFHSTRSAHVTRTMQNILRVCG